MKIASASRFPLIKRYTLLAVVFGAPWVACGQSTPPPEENLKAYIDQARKELTKDKAALMGQAMRLTPDQASKFWPVYSAYTKELDALGDMRLKIVKDYADNFDSMDDQKADGLAKRSFEWETKRSALKQKYYDQVKQALGGKAAARFAQAESRLLAIIDLQIAAQVPLVE